MKQLSQQEQDDVIRVQLQHGIFVDSFFSFASEGLKNDKEIFLAAARYSRQILSIPDVLKYDEDFMLKLVQVYNAYIRDQHHLTSKKKFMHKYLRLNRSDYYLPDDVKRNPYYNLLPKPLYSYHNERTEIVQEGLLRNISVYKFITERQAKELPVSFITEVARRNPLILRYLPDKFKNNFDFVLKAVKKKGEALAFAHRILQDNYEIVHAAVLQNPNALKFAGYNMRNNRDLVQLAVENSKIALKYASRHLRGDKAIAMSSVMKYGLSLRFASIDLRKDVDVVNAAIKQNKYAIKYSLL